MNYVMDTLADEIGVDVLELKYAIVLTSMFPLAFVHRHMYNVTMKHVFSIVFGTFVAIFMFGSDTIHFFTSTFVARLMMQSLPLAAAPWIVTAWQLLYLAFAHWQGFQYHYLTFALDWALPQLMITVKVSSFAWTYHDGQLPLSAMDHPERIAKRIEKMPSLLEYYSFIFFPFGFLTGPFGEYNYYIKFINREIFKDNGGVIPSSWRASAPKVLLCVVSYFALQLNDKYFPDIFMTTDEFLLEYTFLQRLGFIVVCCELGTFKYYFAFSMGELSCNICGASYNGKDKDGNARWDGIVMMRFIQFKTSQNARGIVEHWNVPCQTWLKQYVFLRLRRLVPNRTIAYAGTFFASALWHGFYPGYYLFFLSGAYFGIVSDVMRANLRHFFVQPDGSPKPGKAFYNFGGWLLSFAGTVYITVAFRLLSFERAMKAWTSIYFSYHILGAVVILLFYIFPLKPPQEKIEVLNDMKQD